MRKTPGGQNDLRNDCLSAVRCNDNGMVTSMHMNQHPTIYILFLKSVINTQVCTEENARSSKRGNGMVLLMHRNWHLFTNVLNLLAILYFFIVSNKGHLGPIMNTSKDLLFYSSQNMLLVLIFNGLILG